MASFNGYSVVKRYNRPSILLRTLLEMYFTNNGTYFDPFQVSAVYILPDTSQTNGDPNSYVNYEASDLGTSSYGLLTDEAKSLAVAVFDVSGNNGNYLTESDYSGTDNNNFSGIYKVGVGGYTVGHYGVIIDGEAFPSYSSLGVSDGKWFDAWLVKDFSTVDASAGWHIYWNKFTTYSDRVVTFTEPFQITTRNKLQQRYIQLSSIPTLRITTETLVANDNISKDIKEIWRQSVVENPQIRIRKRNPYTTGEYTTIIDWTSSGVDVSSEDTILYTWDTTSLEKGDYVVQVKYNVLEQTFVSEEFNLVLR